jgi:hypothetical protein
MKEEKDANEPDEKGDDVLPLNIGGAKVHVLRRTLCSGGKSKLAYQFSGVDDDSLTKDSDGNFFIDQDFSLFNILLKNLRARENWTTRSPPVQGPEEASFSNKQEYHSFLGMVEYYELTPVVYPTKIKIHKGQVKDSKVEQYPFRFVGASKLSTFVIATEFHSRNVNSVQIKVGMVEDFRLGWAGDVFLILDLITAKLHAKNGAIEVPSSIGILKEGSVIRCSRSENTFTWEVDGELILKKTFERVDVMMIPAFKFKGTLQVEDVILDY